MKLMVVDDEPTILETLREFFQEEGFRVIVASDGAAAIGLLAQDELPKVIILDLMLPRVSGVEVYAYLQSDPRLASIPVIISTSDPSRAPPGTRVFIKPTRLDRLLKAVREQCAATNAEHGQVDTVGRKAK